MKSQKFTEQQLKDLVTSKEVVTVEPLKEGDYVELWKCSNCGCEIWKPPKDEIIKNALYISLFITNKNKFEKPCPNECGLTISENKISRLKKYTNLDLMVGEVYQASNEKGEDYIVHDTFYKSPEKYFNYKKIKGIIGHLPLLIRLEKIERKERRDIDKSLGSTNFGHEDVWLKTWKARK